MLFTLPYELLSRVCDQRKAIVLKIKKKSFSKWIEIYCLSSDFWLSETHEILTNLKKKKLLLLEAYF